MDYQKQGEDFLTNTGTKMSVKLLGHFPYFDPDDKPRDVYLITFERSGKRWSFKFGQSLANSATEESKAVIENCKHYRDIKGLIKAEAKIKAPTAYDVLSCITKYDPGTFENFCSAFGYSNDGLKAQKIYFDVQKEFENVNNIFGDVLEQLEEIS